MAGQVRVMSRASVRAWGGCVAITMAAHALLLMIPVRPAAAAGPQVSTHSVVRLIEAPTPLMQQSQDVSASAGVDIERVLAATALYEPPARAAARDALEREELQQVPRIAAVEIPTVLGLSLPGRLGEDDQFVVRSLLSAPPMPLAPVVIDYPSLAPHQGRFVGVLTLFIDESGQVVRVRAEGEALPPVLEDAARTAFMAVQFRPGEMAEHGRVKSRIRVEVVFEGGAPLLIG
jgi:periplasmic protein TonB